MEAPYLLNGLLSQWKSFLSFLAKIYDLFLNVLSFSIA